MSRELERAAQQAIERRRRRQLAVLLEVALGDMVALDGIEKTKLVLRHYLTQLEDF